MRTNGSPSPDVIVIGGGIIGVSAAVHLARLGRTVVLLEQSTIGAGASGRNSGVVQHPFDPVLIDLHLETLERYRELAEATDGAFALPIAPVGLLQVTRDPSVAAATVEALARTHPDLSPTYLSPDDVRQAEPGLARDVAACRLDIGYPVGPARATDAYAAWATGMGVEVRTGSGARPSISNGRVTGVVVDGGAPLTSHDVVIAAGPWSPALIDPTGRWRPIRPSWGVVVTIGLGEPPRHVLEEADIKIEPTMVSDAAGAQGESDDADEPAYSFSLVTADGASSLGSTFLPAEPDPSLLVDGLVERGSRYVPAIGTARRGAHRVCARPQSLDGRPLVGPVPGIDGLWIAAGHGPWGISTGPATGRRIADLVTDPTAVVQEALDPARFGPIGDR